VGLLQGGTRKVFSVACVCSGNEGANAAVFLGRVVVGVNAADHHIFQLE